VLQSSRTKILRTQTDVFSAKTASELCGKEDQWKVNYNISTRGHDARVSLWKRNLSREQLGGHWQSQAPRAW